MKGLKFILPLALFGASAASAQRFVPPRPVAPALVSPAGGATMRGEAGSATAFQVKFNHWQILNAPQQPMPTHFVVCLKPASQAANCGFAPADFVGVGSLPQPTRLFNGLVHSGYQYTLSLPAIGTTINDGLLDVDLTLSVGACSSAAAIACNFSPESALFLSARDLKPGNVSDGFSTMANAVFDHEFDNLGSTAIPDMPLVVIQVIEWQAQLNANEQCRTDLNHADFIDNPNAILFTDDGTGRWIVDLPKKSGKRVVTGTVVGIHLWNGGAGVFADSLPFGRTLNPGGTGSVQKIVSVPNAQRPRGYINVTWTDQTGVVREFDETNNSRAECSVVRRVN